MNKTLKFFVSIAVIVGLATVIFLKVVRIPIKMGSILEGTPSVSSVTVIPASTTLSLSTIILPANAAREYAEICNSGSSDVFVVLTNTTSTASVNVGGRIVKYTECYKISDTEGNLWFGKIFANASSTTSTLSILEK